MSDTLTAAPSAAPAAPATPVTPTTPVAPSIEQAGATLKSATSWADAGFAAPADTAVETPAVATEGETPAAEAVAEPEFVQNAQGQWHRPDGTFANADEIAAIDAQIAADAAATPPAETTETPTEPAANTITLRRRDGTTRDVVVDDPELAQEIQQNFKDGMRRKEFVEKAAALDARLNQFNHLDALITRNPEAFVEQSLTREQKVRLTTMLLAEHFDDLVPIINAYNQNPSERIAATAEAQVRIRDQKAEFNSFTAAQQRATECRVAVESLIPETVTPEIAEQFWADASSDLQRAIARGETVDSKTVPALLTNRMKLYGFETAPVATSKPRIIAAPATASGSTPAQATTVAQPANDAAKALADAKNTQRRIKLTQRNRANAAAVPPVGAGAAPVRLPPVPQGASIEQASAHLKKMPSWASS